MSGDASIHSTVGQLDRSTRWELVGSLQLRDDVHHPQGMVRLGDTWWISTVDLTRRRGFVLAVDAAGAVVDRTPVGDERRYHPGGMDHDGTAFWVASSEYRPDSSATISRLLPGGVPERVFDVDDHVGAIVRCGPAGDLVGWSWGSRRFWRWTIDGAQVDTRANPGFFIDHQDGQWLDSGHVLCAGVADVRLADRRGWLGGLGLLDAASLRIEREIPFPRYSPQTGRVATHNPIWAETVDDRLVVHLLPDDDTPTLLSYATLLR